MASEALAHSCASCAVCAMARTKGARGAGGAGAPRGRGRRRSKAGESDVGRTFEEDEKEKSKESKELEIEEKLERQGEPSEPLKPEPERPAKVAKLDGDPQPQQPQQLQAQVESLTRRNPQGSMPSAEPARVPQSESPGRESETSSNSSCEISSEESVDGEFAGLWKTSKEKPKPNRTDFRDNESGMDLTIEVSEKRSHVHAFRNGCFVWSSRFSQIEKKTFGQGFVAFATRHHVHVLSSADGIPVFPALRLNEALEEMQIQHGFLLLLCQDGQIKILDLSRQICVVETSLRDLCEPTELSEESLQLNAQGEFSLHLSNRHSDAAKVFVFDSSLRLWISGSESAAGKVRGARWHMWRLEILKTCMNYSCTFSLADRNKILGCLPGHDCLWLCRRFRSVQTLEN